jgi:hypothetical protein
MMHHNQIVQSSFIKIIMLKKILTRHHTLRVAQSVRYVAGFKSPNAVDTEDLLYDLKVQALSKF